MRLVLQIPLVLVKVTPLAMSWSRPGVRTVGCPSAPKSRAGQWSTQINSTLGRGIGLSPGVGTVNWRDRIEAGGRGVKEEAVGCRLLDC